ncbi:unnamed protein product [Moneuplotes crassus]|uniref:Uncharacterized protein n=1 Tax=Euplotes crassus TaxID=5936 RepID=A0AAD1Y6Y7_EUPCR|nr:unnamed protein product [Moneuplotes crassus]
MNQFWIQYMGEDEEDTSIKDIFNYLHSQADGLAQKLSLINEVTENEQAMDMTSKDNHEEMDRRRGSQLTANKAPDISCSTPQWSQEVTSLNLILLFETLYRLSYNGLSQKIYYDSYENIRSYDLMCWFQTRLEPGNDFDVNHGNPEDSLFYKKVRKVTLPCFKRVVIKTDSKSLKLFQKCVAHFSPYNCVENLKFVALEPIEIGLHLSQIFNICARIQKVNSLRGFSLNETQFKKFLVGCRHQVKVSFLSCKFNISRVPDLSKLMKGTVIKTILFDDCAQINKWKKHPEKLERLISAISSCNLKESLRQILFRNSIQQDFVSPIFEKYGLGHIKVIISRL